MNIAPLPVQCLTLTLCLWLSAATEANTNQTNNKGNETEGTLYGSNRESGKIGCPCVDRLEERFESNCVFGDEPGVSVFGRCYPNSYGALGCKAYDLVTMAECLQPDALPPPGWCFNQFCYVDPEKCRTSFDHFYQSSIFPGRYYSYSTCGSAAQDWFTHLTIDSLANISLTAVVPGIVWPSHYKTDNSGESIVLPESAQAYNNSIPWMGYMIDYFKAVVKISNIRDATFVHRSKGSQTKGHSGQYSQAVTDVAAGIADMSASAFWVTAERLKYVPFTVPFGNDAIRFWVPYRGSSKKNVGFKENYLKLSQPFSDGLWAAIGMSILAFAILSVVVSPKATREFNKPAASLSHKIQRGLLIMSDALNSSALDFLGGGLNARETSNLPQKWLNLGFALIIFIAVSAYTANLAAFLTIQAASQHLSSVEEAIAANIPLCASAVLKSELNLLYPSAKWIFRPEFHLIREAYDEGLCGGIVQGWVDVRADPQTQAWYCERKLVQVGKTILDELLAFPANPQMVGGLSHWIVEAQTHGIMFESYITQVEAMCPLDIQMIDQGMEVESDLNQLTVKNMVVPLTLFGFCCVIALIMHSGHSFIRGKSKTPMLKDPMPIMKPSLLDEPYFGTGRALVKGFEMQRKPKIQSVEPVRGFQSVDNTGAEHTLEDLLAVQLALFCHLKGEEAMEDLLASQWARLSHVKHSVTPPIEHGNPGQDFASKPRQTETNHKDTTSDSPVTPQARRFPSEETQLESNNMRSRVGTFEDRLASYKIEKATNCAAATNDSIQRVDAKCSDSAAASADVQGNDPWWQRTEEDVETESRVLDVLLTK